ncbi:MAG: type II toxin-antitoxin system VapC family toxin [Deltaproteobacteria bacterium]|nr:type II toxin-antitoxin system VapC family toxin [Deltaproteobacteria bacterium]
MYFLDTNTLIYFFKGMGRVAEMLLSKSPRDISIPAVALYELEVGIAKSKKPEARRKQLQTLTAQVSIAPFGTREAEAAAIIRAHLESMGMPIGPYDTLIAGIAFSRHAILVTHNTGEFERVNGLELEDWF